MTLRNHNTLSTTSDPAVGSTAWLGSPACGSSWVGFWKRSDRYEAWMAVRLGIMADIKSGKITLAQGQAELAAIQRQAKKLGLPTAYGQ